MSRPYAVPTALTHLWRSPSKDLRKGDGVVLVWPDGARHYGTVASSDAKGATVEFPGGEIAAPVVWEEGS